jgi:Tfp pilus assembly protein PilF
VLEGSVRAVGDDLRVTAKLIDVVTDTQVWSETYRRKLENIFALQGDIADSIAGALKVEVTLTSKDRDAPTKDLEAYRYYLEGLNEYRQRDAPPGARVIDLFDRAVARDPKFAEAHAALAAAYFSQLNFELDDARQWAARARASAEAALGLNPKLGLAHGILGVLDRGDLDWEAAVASGRKAVALDSANSFTHFWLGTTLARLGYTGEAAKLIEEAHRVDPLHRVASVWPMIIEANRGNWEGAERIARTIAESQRSLTLHNYYLTSWAFGRGDGATAEKYYRLAISPADKDRPFVAAVIKALHSKQATNAAIAALEAEAASNANFEPHRHFFVLRADDAIIRRVTQQIESGDTQRLVYTMLAGIWSPPFKALRNDPRFKDVLRRLRLVDYWKKHGWPDRCRPKGEDDFECS